MKTTKKHFTKNCEIQKKPNYKVSKNEHTTDEDRNKQIHYHIKKVYNTIKSRCNEISFVNTKFFFF